jgi:electron transport complex protein RnfB
LIDESRCIGCTVCIKACPVDAIVGGFKAMHTVLLDRCTGCELCIAPCPVDCIVMADCIGPAEWTEAHALRAREQFEARERRLQREAAASPTETPAPGQLAMVLARAKQRAASRST